MLSTMLVLAAIMGVVNISNYREMLKYHSGKNHYKYKNGCKTKNGYRDRRHKYCSEIRDLPAAVQKDIFLSFFSLYYSVTVNPLKPDISW